MTLSELFPPDRVLRLHAADKDAALAELARRGAAPPALPASDVAAALRSREALGSTGVGGGVAVPHARLAGLARPTGLFARLDRAIDWGAIDGKPVDLLFLLLTPADATADHLGILAAGTRRLRDPDVARALRAAPDAQALRAALLP